MEVPFMNRSAHVLSGFCAGIVALALGCSSNPAGPGDAGDAGWAGIGGDGGEVSSGASYGRIAAGGGKVFVAFSDSNLNGQLTVMQSSGSGWAAVGNPGFTSAVVDATYLALAVDASGTPWVAYVSNYAVSVAKLSGGAWVTQGSAGFAQPSGSISLAIAGGAPYIAYGDGTGAHVMMLNGATWSDLAIASPLMLFFPILGTDGTTVYLAYNDMMQSQLVLAKLSGTSWTTLATSTVTIEDDWSPSVNVSSGSVFVGLSNYTNGPVVLQLTGSTLTSVGNIGDIAGGDSIESLSMTVYNGVPYVAFDDESRDGDPEPRAATVKYWDGAHWTLYAGYANPCDIEDTVITNDPSTGKLYLTYEDCNGFMAVDVH
jgi:hypothetical protein